MSLGWLVPEYYLCNRALCLGRTWSSSLRKLPSAAAAASARCPGCQDTFNPVAAEFKPSTST